MNYKVLLITSYFPPIGGAGVYRWYHFVKNMADKVDFYVLTPGIETGEPEDFSLSDTINKIKVIEKITPLSPGTVIKRIKPYIKYFTGKKIGNDDSNNGRISRLQPYFQFPDQRIAEIPKLILKGRKITNDNPPDLIVVTAPHYSYILAALKLKKIMKIPLIIDLRDPWTINPLFKFPNEFYKKINDKFEEKSFEIADAIVVVSDNIKNEYVKKYPLYMSKFKVIYNGYDEETINLKGKADKTDNRQEKILAYTGTLYKNRDPEPVFKGVSEFFKRYKDEYKLKIYFVGELKPPWNKKFDYLIKKYSLQGRVVHKEYMSHLKLLEFLENTDGLINIAGDYMSGITGKIFEYLVLNKPLIVYDELRSDSYKFLKNIGAEFYTIDSEDDMVKVLVDLSGNRLKSPNVVDKIEKFSRRKLSEEMFALMEEIIENR